MRRVCREPSNDNGSEDKKESTHKAKKSQIIKIRQPHGFFGPLGFLSTQGLSHHRRRCVPQTKGGKKGEQDNTKTNRVTGDSFSARMAMAPSPTPRKIALPKKRNESEQNRIYQGATDPSTKKRIRRSIYLILMPTPLLLKSRNYKTRLALHIDTPNFFVAIEKNAKIRLRKAEVL